MKISLKAGSMSAGDRGYENQNIQQTDKRTAWIPASEITSCGPAHIYRGAALLRL